MIFWGGLSWLGEQRTISLNSVFLHMFWPTHTNLYWLRRWFRAFFLALFLKPKRRQQVKRRCICKRCGSGPFFLYLMCQWYVVSWSTCIFEFHRHSSISGHFKMTSGTSMLAVHYGIYWPLISTARILMVKYSPLIDTWYQWDWWPHPMTCFQLPGCAELTLNSRIHKEVFALVRFHESILEV